MKVSVILTGHMRCWQQVWPNFKEKIVDRYNPDIFIHTWSDEAWHGPGKNSLGFIANTPPINQDEIVKTYNPTKMVVEDFYANFNQQFESLGSKYPNFSHVPKNTLSMFYKTFKGVQLLEDHMSLTNTHYDLVIRMRPDLVFHNDLPNWDPSKFYSIAMKNHLGQGTGADMQIGNVHAMINFSKLSCYIPMVYNQTQLLCSHLLTEKWIRLLGLPWQEFYVHKTIMHTPRGEYADCRDLAGDQNV